MIGLFIMALVVLCLRLIWGPLDVTFLKPILHLSTYSKTTPLMPEIENISINFKGVHEPLVLNLKEVTFFDASKKPLFKLPNVNLLLDYGELLKGTLYLKSVNFLEPEIIIYLGEESLEEHEKEEFEISGISKILDLLKSPSKNTLQTETIKGLEMPSFLKELQEVSLEKGTLTFFREGSIILKTGINAKLIYQKTLQEPSFLFRGDVVDLHLSLPEWDRRTFQVKALNISGTYDDKFNTFKFETSSFNWQGTEAQAQGKGVLSEDGIIHLDVDFKAVPLPLGQFSDVWPENLAESTRSWILENLSQGDIDHISVHLKGEIPLFSHGKIGTFFKVTQLKGGFNINKIKVQYIDGLPDAHEVSGIARFDEDTFDIEVKEGHIESIQATKGLIHFYDLSKEKELSDITLTLTGNLQKILEIIDRKPLKYPTLLGIHPHDFQGTAEVTLHLAFPLLRHLTLDEINVSTKARLQDISYTHLLDPAVKEGKKIKVEKGLFDLEVDKLHLSLKGRGYLKGIKTEIAWVEKFKESRDFSRKFSLKGTYPLSLLEDFGIVLERFMTGTLGLDLLVKEKHKEYVEVEVNGDLKEVKIGLPEVDIHKEKGTPGILSFQARLPAEEGIELPRWKFSNILLQSPHTFIKGCAEFDGKTQEIVMLNLNSLKTPQNDLTFFMNKTLKNLYKIKIRGKKFELGGIFKGKEFSFETFSSKEPKEKKKPPFDFSLELLMDHVSLEKKPMINALNLILERVDNQIDKAHAKGQLKDGSLFWLNYEYLKKILGHNLSFYTLNAGEFLKLVGIEHLKGGKLRIEGIRWASTEVLEGKVFLDEFYVFETPFFTKLLSLPSLDGITEMLRGEKEIFFRNASCHFKGSEKEVGLSHGLAESSSLGITFEGSITRPQNKINLKGTLIPFYMFNSLIGKIPFLGSLLSGGKNKGFLAAPYEIKGSLDSPHLSINALGLLAPGFLREMF